jgi:hypothetical protein
MGSGHRLGYLLANATDNGTTFRNAAAFSFYASDNWSSGYYPAHGTLEASNGTGARVELFRWGGTGTSGVTINEGGLDRDTRIEGDTDTNLFFADASTDRIGIGNNAPTQKLDITGNIAVSGTVDGRDIATDGSKLDGIEAGATADQTAADVPFDNTILDSYGVAPATQVQEAVDNFAVAMVAAFSGFATVASTGVHADLTGLADDDHTQYALLAGRSGGQTAYGGTGLTDSLSLYANDETIDGKTNTGRIDFKSQMKYNPTFTAASTYDGGFFNMVDAFAMEFAPTVTLQSGTNGGGSGILRNQAVIKYSNSQLLTACPTFQSLSTLQPTASVSDNSLASWVSFQAMDNFSPDLSTAVNATTYNHWGMVSSPRASIKAGSHASATATVTNLVCYNAFYGLLGTAGSQSTVTTATGYEVNNPVVTGTGAITNVIGIDVDALTIGGTSNIGLRMAKANTYTIQLSDTGGTAAGGITFGTDTNLYRSAANVLKTDDKLFVTGELELDGALNHDGTTVGFFGTAPATQSTGWSATNVTTDKSFDANATTIDELADVVGTLIDTLKTMGIIGA